MRTILAVAGATILASCFEEELVGPPATPGVYAALRGTELATVGEPGPADLPFGEALVTYSHELGGLHAGEREQTDAGITQVIFQLATALERIPAGSAEPSLRRAAAAMRAEVSKEGAEHQQRALALAATELARLAGTHYRGSPEVGAAARELAGAVDAIDVQRVPPDRSAFIDALVRAERALAAIYAVNVGPAHPG